MVETLVKKPEATQKVESVRVNATTVPDAILDAWYKTVGSERVLSTEKFAVFIDLARDLSVTRTEKKRHENVVLEVAPEIATALKVHFEKETVRRHEPPGKSQIISGCLDMKALEAAWTEVGPKGRASLPKELRGLLKTHEPKMIEAAGKNIPAEQIAELLFRLIDIPVNRSAESDRVLQCLCEDLKEMELPPEVRKRMELAIVKAAFRCKDERHPGEAINLSKAFPDAARLFKLSREVAGETAGMYNTVQYMASNQDTMRYLLEQCGDAKAFEVVSNTFGHHMPAYAFSKMAKATKDPVRAARAAIENMKDDAAAFLVTLRGIGDDPVLQKYDGEFTLVEDAIVKCRFSGEAFKVFSEAKNDDIATMRAAAIVLGIDEAKRAAKESWNDDGRVNAAASAVLGEGGRNARCINFASDVAAMKMLLERTKSPVISFLAAACMMRKLPSVKVERKNDDDYIGFVYYDRLLKRMFLDNFDRVYASLERVGKKDAEIMQISALVLGQEVAADDLYSFWNGSNMRLVKAAVDAFAPDDAYQLLVYFDYWSDKRGKEEVFFQELSNAFGERGAIGFIEKATSDSNAFWFARHVNPESPRKAIALLEYAKWADAKIAWSALEKLYPKYPDYGMEELKRYLEDAGWFRARIKEAVQDMPNVGTAGEKFERQLALAGAMAE